MDGPDESGLAGKHDVTPTVPAVTGRCPWGALCRIALWAEGSVLVSLPPKAKAGMEEEKKADARYIKGSA